jgi:hypothetical protein
MTLEHINLKWIPISIATLWVLGLELPLSLNLVQEILLLPQDREQLEEYFYSKLGT